VIEFANDEVKNRWMAQALKAVQPRLAELVQPTRKEVPADDFSDVPF